jgi:hypothetical protein
VDEQPRVFPVDDQERRSAKSRFHARGVVKPPEIPWSGCSLPGCSGRRRR